MYKLLLIIKTPIYVQREREQAWPHTSAIPCDDQPNLDVLLLLLLLFIYYYLFHPASRVLTDADIEPTKI